MSSRVFITGISGFIGQALARYFLARGMSVSGLARGAFRLDGCHVIAGEVAHPASYATDLSRAQIVIHLAGPTLAAEINSYPLEAMKVSLRGTANVLDCFRAGDGEHLIYFSSGKVYGTPKQLPVNENEMLNPTTVLGHIKQAAEDLICFYAEHTNKRFTIFRLFNAYGPGQKPGFLIPTIFNQLDKGVVTLGDTTGRRDFVYIDDVVEAAGAALFDSLPSVASSYTPSPRVAIFNVGSGISSSPQEIVSLLEEITGQKLSIEVDQKRLRGGEPAEECSDITRIKSLGWRPKVSMKDGLTSTWRAFSDGTK